MTFATNPTFYVAMLLAVCAVLGLLILLRVIHLRGSNGEVVYAKLPRREPTASADGPYFIEYTGFDRLDGLVNKTVTVEELVDLLFHGNKGLLEAANELGISEEAAVVLTGMIPNWVLHKDRMWREQANGQGQ